MDADQVAVNHNTRVTLKLPPVWKPDHSITAMPDVNRDEILAYGEACNSRCVRAVEMMDFLEKLGFRISSGKDCLFADSTEMEAKDVKLRLIAAGFHDREFQIVLEYTRKWGML